jgi:Zn-dependent M28 family amino/carboxypeptidase
MDDMPAGALAPGADDNGSGSVAVLMAARLLAPHDFAHTVRFVLFTGEEQGLHGSAAYAADCAARGEDIEGVVNLDMIGYNSDATPVIDLYARTDVAGSLELTRLFSEVVGIYGLNLVPDRFSDTGPVNQSDQASFLNQGYPAFLAIEDVDDFTPYYHSVWDTLATIDLDYYADFTRAAIATIAHLGRPVPVRVYLPLIVHER